MPASAVRAANKEAEGDPRDADAVSSYSWSPSHDQRGIFRPPGTSSAEWWYRDIVVVVAQAK
jgi:hypothetical protein